MPYKCENITSKGRLENHSLQLNKSKSRRTISEMYKPRSMYIGLLLMPTLYAQIHMKREERKEEKKEEKEKEREIMFTCA